MAGAIVTCTLNRDVSNRFISAGAQVHDRSADSEGITFGGLLTMLSLLFRSASTPLSIFTLPSRPQKDTSNRLHRLSAPQRRRLDRQSARAIECLAHAIEYLEDTTPLHAPPTSRTRACVEAISMLKSRNREIFAGRNGTGHETSQVRTSLLLAS